MQEKKIIKVTDKIIHIKDIHSVGIIGDPGCEGLGTNVHSLLHIMTTDKAIVKDFLFVFHKIFLE